MRPIIFPLFAHLVLLMGSGNFRISLALLSFFVSIDALCRLKIRLFFSVILLLGAILRKIPFLCANLWPVASGYSTISSLLVIKHLSSGVRHLFLSLSSLFYFS